MSSNTVEFKVKITDDGGFKKLEVDADDFNSAVKRIKNEEEVLEKGLEGYTEYKKKVKYRLIPFIW